MALGEIGAQYEGIAPNDPKMEPYWALAEELDIPVGLHTGLAPARTPYTCCPKFRNVARQSRAPGRSVDPTPQAARLPDACRLSVLARDDSHHAHVPSGVCGLWAQLIGSAARGIPRVPAGASARRVWKAADVRVGSDGLAGGDRDGHRRDRVGELSDGRAEARHFL